MIENERYCKYCGEQIPMERVRLNTNKIYCDYQCSADYNILRDRVRTNIRKEYYREYKDEINKRTEKKLEKEIKIMRERMDKSFL